MIRLPGVLSITSKLAQEKGVIETVLREGALVTISLRSPGVLNITEQIAQEEVGHLCWEGGLCNISLSERTFTN